MKHTETLKAIRLELEQAENLPNKVLRVIKFPNANFVSHVGFTPDGSPVVDGMFILEDTHGLPLDIILSTLKKDGTVVDWEDYFISVDKAGRTFESYSKRVLHAVTDVYGKDYAEDFKPRLQLLLMYLVRKLGYVVD